LLGQNERLILESRDRPWIELQRRVKVRQRSGRIGGGAGQPTRDPTSLVGGFAGQPLVTVGLRARDIAAALAGIGPQEIQPGLRGVVLEGLGQISFRFKRVNPRLK
jgi:hypothetical protein